MCEELVAYLDRMGDVEVSIVTIYVMLVASMFTFVGVMELLVKKPKNSQTDEAERKDHNDRLVA